MFVFPIINPNIFIANAKAMHIQAAPAEDPVKFSGYLDLSYNHINGAPTFSSGSANRSFDLETNGVRWQQFSFTIADQPKQGLGGLVNVTTGKDADIITSTGMSGNNMLDLTQIFLQYVKGPYTLSAGKFVTFAGQESIASPSNWNFSKSILFTEAPFTHTGARLQYNNGGKLTAAIGLNNGWDQFLAASNGKTLEAQVNYTFNSKVALSTQGYFGQEPVSATQNADRSFVDVIATVTLNPSTTFVLNADFGQQKQGAANGGTAKWTGYAAYLHKTLNPKWAVTLRAETFDDKDGYKTGIVQKWNEATLTFGYTPNATHELRFEGRSDMSNSASFTDRFGQGAKKNLQSFGVEYLYKF